MPRLMRTVARTAVVAGTATAVSNRVSRRQAGRWNDQAAAQQQAAPQYAEPQYAPPPPQAVYAAAPEAASTDDKLAQLSQLGALRDAGVLTDIEFEVQKNKILSS